MPTDSIPSALMKPHNQIRKLSFFKKEMGISPYRYILKKRLVSAQERIANGESTEEYIPASVMELINEKGLYR